MRKTLKIVKKNSVRDFRIVKRCGRYKSVRVGVAICGNKLAFMSLEATCLISTF